MAGGWKPYVFAFDRGIASLPVLAGSNMYALAGNSTGTGRSLVQCTSSGVLTGVSGASTGTTNGFSQVATDGTYLYDAVKDNNPSTETEKWLIGSPWTRTQLVGFGQIGGTVVVGGLLVMPMGDRVHTASVPALTVNDNHLYADAGTPLMHAPIYDGSARVWTPIGGTTIMRSFVASALGTTSTYAVSSTLASFGSYGGTPTCPQTGFDGQYIYCVASAGGIVVFDTVGHTSSTFGSTVLIGCYYSNNMGQVYAADSAGNLYTMPAGGGSLTSAGSILTIIEPVPTQVFAGFVDDAAGHIWCTAATTGANQGYWWMTPGASNAIVMLLAKRHIRDQERRHWRFEWQRRDRLYLPAPLGAT